MAFNVEAVGESVQLREFQKHPFRGRSDILRVTRLGHFGVVPGGTAHRRRGPRLVPATKVKQRKWLGRSRRYSGAHTVATSSRYTEYLLLEPRIEDDIGCLHGTPSSSRLLS